MAPPRPPVAILLSTFDGAPFLPAQLDSFARQEGIDWTLYWRDDGSNDGTVALLRAFAGTGAGAGRCYQVPGGIRLGVIGSYMALLRHAVAQGAGLVAFSDQDDVWLPGKLARGADALAGQSGPALYCARQVLVDAGLRPLGESPVLRIEPGLGPALTQNVATGCTVMLNPAATRLVGGSQPPACSLHDWWSYLLVAAAGGRIVADRTPTVLYRQHGGNAVGAPPSSLVRAGGALRRGPGVFMTVLRAHVAALQAQHHLLAPSAMPMLDAVAAALAGGWRRRLAVLARYRLLRQTPAETALFRLWFLTG